MTLGGLLFNRRTNQQYRLDGCRRSRVQPLLKFAKPFLSLLSRQRLPNIVDLRSFLSPIEEQYTLGSCVGNALASILEYFYFYSTGHTKKFSRLFIYYNARMMEDETSKRNATETDSGADLQFGIVSLIKYGCCEEQYWPFYEHLINIQPNNQAYENGQNYCLDDFSRLSNNITQLRECLAEGYPFVMAIKIFPSFASNHHGYIPMPKKNEKPSQYRHAVVCVGYNHSEKVFIIRNSHGFQWGHYGYGYLPYDYIADKVLTKDLWAIKSIKNMTQIPIEQHIAWNDSPMLSKSISKHDLADDRSVCDIVYSSDDDDDEFGVSQDRRSEYSKSPAPQQQEKNHFVQPQFINNFPLVHNPPPVVFANTPFIGLYPYQQPMFNPTFFFRPY
jgi:C1A family cysteine protease